MEGKIITNEIRFYPLLVSSAGLEHQSDSESDQVWEKLDQIPVQNKRVLLSAAIIENLYNAEQKFQWTPYCSARLAYFTRELFFQNISQSEFYKAVEALLLPLFQGRFNEILNYINNVILTSQPDPEEIEEDEVVSQPDSVKQYPLLDALAKFSNLGNQTITTEPIKLKTQVAPVRPTLTNWLKNYRDELGIGVHDAVARAQFLFESLNTRALPSEERDRIHAMVRSLEDNELLAIDTQKQVIIFAPEKTIPATASDAPRDQTSETSPDIFDRFQNIASVPREELKNVGSQTFTPAVNAMPGQKETAERAVLSRIKDMIVFPQKANAPAPEEDFEFALPPQEQNQHPTTEPLGTLRFSANHVLPSEREDNESFTVSPSLHGKLEHFSPQAIAIPGDKGQESHFTTGPQATVHAPRVNSQQPTPNLQSATFPAPEKNVPTTATPPVAPVQRTPPTSVFRIKPNRDE